MPPRSQQSQVRKFIGDILDVLERYHGLSLPIEFSHGLLSLFAQELGVRSLPGAREGRDAVQADAEPAPGRTGRRGPRLSRGKRPSGGVVPTETELLSILSRKKMTLKELSVHYGVKPWTPLQEFLGHLEKAGKIEKIARRYRVKEGARSGKRAVHDQVEEAIEAAERKKEESQSSTPDASPAEQEASRGERGEGKAGKGRKHAKGEQEAV